MKSETSRLACLQAMADYSLSETSFLSVNLRTELTQNLDSLGYHRMTPVQAQALPIIISGNDLIAQAKTGSGKTAAFGLGLLNSLDVSKFRIQALVLCPTRELADQVASEIRRLARGIHNIKVLTLCGGKPLGPQIGSLEHGAHIIVGTPGRIEEHLRKGSLVLNTLTIFVLDEADRMLDMGFAPVVETIVSSLPSIRQSLLFSATFPDEIERLADKVLKNPKRVTVDTTHDTDSIEELGYLIAGEDERLQSLQLILLHHKPVSTVIFCNTKVQTDEVADFLRNNGFAALAIHGDLEQRDRDTRLIRFANQSATILVATDVAARGLDIDDIGLVINYQIARDLEVHTHRVGRTGRAGAVGVAVALYTQKETYKLELLESHLGYELKKTNLPKHSLSGAKPEPPQTTTIEVEGGKKQKIRAGDLLGTLTSLSSLDGGIKGSEVGKISITDRSAYIAVNRQVASQALAILRDGKVKGRSLRARIIG